MVEPRVLEQPRRPVRLLVGTAIVVIVSALAFVFLGPRDLMAWVFVGLAVMAAAICVRTLTNPARMALDGDGFTLTGGQWVGTWRYRWRDVKGFHIVSPVRSNVRYVVYVLVDGVSPPWGLSRENRHEGGLPGVFGSSVEDLTQTLNAYREQALAETHEG